jgi:type I restriction enzyme S subunit
MPKKQRPVVPRLRFPEFRDAGPWEVKQLGEVAKIIKERIGDRDAVLLSVTAGVGLVPQVEKFGREIAGNQKRNYFAIRENDFAYNKSATKDYPQGYIGLYKGDKLAAVPNSIFTCFRPTQADILPAYLDYLFAANYHGNWLQRLVTVGARAHGFLNIDDRDLLEMPLPIPPSTLELAEQQKIADCLTSLDEVIQLETQKLQALQAHKQGLMQELFPREGETTPRLRFPEFRGAGPWEKVPLASLGEFYRGLSYSPEDVSVEGLLVLRAGNIRDGILSLDSDLVFVSKPCPEDLLLQRGDIVICMSNGSRTLVGKAGEFDQEYAWPVTVVAFCAIFRPSNTFARFAFRTLRYQAFVEGNIAGGNINNLRISDVEGFEMDLPPLATEQQKIADCLTSLDEVIKLQTKKLEALKAHKKGLMQRLFPEEVG